MAIWIAEESKLLIQGITGSQGRFHGEKMVEYGTDVVGGVTPGKGGQSIELADREVPVFNSMLEAINATGADASVIYVPPPFAAEAIMEAADAFDPSRAKVSLSASQKESQSSIWSELYPTLMTDLVFDSSDQIAQE